MSFQARLAPTEKEMRKNIQEQVRKIILEAMQNIVKSDPQTRYMVADFIQTELDVKPETVNFSVTISQDSKKTITILGYWKNSEYVKIPLPAKIILGQ